MVQVLPAIPSFGEKLGSALSNAGINVAEGFAKRKTNINDARILEELGNNDSLTDIQKLTRFGQLSPQKQQTLGPVYSQLLKSQFKQQEKAETAKSKQQQENAEKQLNLQNTNNILDELEGLKSYVGGPFGSKTYGGSLRRETVQKRQQINTASIALEGFFRDLSTKGALPKAVFNELLSRIPRAGMSEREYQGAIDGIRTILRSHGLNLPGEGKGVSSEAQGSERTVQMQDSQGNLYNIPDNQVKAASKDGLKVSRG